MEISSIVIGAVALGASVAFIMRPFQKGTVKGRNRSTETLQSRANRESVLSALRALDFDFKTGKVTDEDYGTLRAQLLTEAAQLMQVEQKMEDDLEALIRNRKNSRKQTVCESCGAAVQAGQHFCSECGSAVKAEECPACGNKIKPRDVFCTSCGHRLDLQVEAVGQA